MLNKKLRGIIQIFRPELPFSAGVCVVLGEIVALGKFPSLREMALGFICGFFISGSAIVLNDYFDLEVDKVNAPTRPLPAGIVSPFEAILVTVIASFIGLSASFLISVPAFVLCLLFWLIGFLYNWKFKEAGLLGNLMVSSSVAITFILGGMAVGDAWNKIVWCFALIGFCIDLGEEIAGDAMDMEGDKKRGSKSIALMKGKRFALSISSSLFGLVILVSLLPVLFGWLGVSYLVMISIMDVLIIVFTVRLLKSKTSAEGVQSMRGIYLGALIGMLAFIIGNVFNKL
ncbi:MAG: UbiA family prenyltransferase [Anaerolineales bacterium]|nr:UbiA family prenyltransferase [Anaerolineales bacterium]